MIKLYKKIYNLIKKSVSTLPKRVKKDIENYKCTSKSEICNLQMNLIKENIIYAQKQEIPICQDTGFPVFYCFINNIKQKKIIKNQAKKAIVLATKDGLLRPNVVDPISRKNTLNNISKDSPIFHFFLSENEYCEIIFFPKGGGSENCSFQKMLLPNTDYKKVILEKLKEIQGKGCGPCYLGICVGSNFDDSCFNSKKIILDYILGKGKMNEEEKKFLKQVNGLLIGPMGLSKDPTCLGLKILKKHTHPATLPVSLTYLCWCARASKLRCKI